MQVGLTNSGSAAHSDSSRPSATVKVERAFSGGTWARAAAGASRAVTSTSRRGHGFMAVVGSGKGGEKRRENRANNSIEGRRGPRQRVRRGGPLPRVSVRRIKAEANDKHPPSERKVIYI